MMMVLLRGSFPLPKQCWQGARNILQPGWTGCLTTGNPVPSQAGIRLLSLRVYVFP
jgi:hypothetical protein